MTLDKMQSMTVFGLVSFALATTDRNWFWFTVGMICAKTDDTQREKRTKLCEQAYGENRELSYAVARTMLRQWFVELDEQ